MFRELSIFSKIMFGSVAALLLVTLALGITTAVKASKGEINNPSPSLPPQIADLSGTPKPTGIAGGDVTPAPTEEPAKPILIAIDPGQQKTQNKDLEPIGPGSATTIEKMGYGATSATTKEREYLWTQRMAELIKTELEARDYQVLLVREVDEDNVSNSERAQRANDAKADMLIGLQLDASSTTTTHGMYVQYASSSNPYIPTDAISGAKKLGDLMHENLIAKTGANDRGVRTTDKLASINWAKMPSVVLTLGYASNPEEDGLLHTDEYLQKITAAICDSIDTYLRME